MSDNPSTPQVIFLQTSPPPTSQTVPVRKKKSGQALSLGASFVLVLLVIAIAAGIILINPNSFPEIGLITLPGAVPANCGVDNSTFIDFKENVPTNIPSLVGPTSYVCFDSTKMTAFLNSKITVKGKPVDGRSTLASFIVNKTANNLGKATDTEWINSTFNKVYAALDPAAYLPAQEAGFLYAKLPGLSEGVSATPTGTNQAVLTPTVQVTPTQPATQPTTPPTTPPTAIPPTEIPPQPTPVPIIEPTKPVIPSQISIWDLKNYWDLGGWSSMITGCVQGEINGATLDFGKTKVVLDNWQFMPYYTYDACVRDGGQFKIVKDAHFGEHQWVQMGDLWLFPSGCEASGCPTPHIADRDLPRELADFYTTLKRTGATVAVSDGHDKFNWLMRYDSAGTKDYLVLNTVGMPNSCYLANKITVSTQGGAGFTQIGEAWVKCE